MHIKKMLNADYLFSIIKNNFKAVPDWRKSNSKISIADSLMSAFAMFNLKDNSILQFEKRLQVETTKNNLKAIYQIENVPSDSRMREINDEVDPSYLSGSFKDVFRPLQRGKELNKFKFLGKYYLVLMDGTGYFTSDKIHCENCLVKESKKTGIITYSHSMLGAVIAHPKMKEVIPLCPEPIIKQDGQKKNDCERNAGKRLLGKIRSDHPKLPMIIVEDALASNMPHINELQKNNMSFILGVKPAGNKFIFEHVNEQVSNSDNVEDFTIIDGNTTQRYRYINNVPLNERNQDFKVNFFEYWEESDKGKWKHFSWITDLEINQNTIKRLVKAGRARWKIENETFNTLKNQNYNFEHNYGHGSKNLSVNLALLMMLAFLVDQIQQLCCKYFQAALEKEERKLYLWQKVREIFNVFALQSWQELLEAIIYGYKTPKLEILNDSS